MKMRETSRAQDKKPAGNNNLLGKSFLCAVFCVARCILYPGSKIVITAKTRSQAIEILDSKIMKELVPKSENLRNEIKKVEINQSKAQILFKNGSYIQVATANENSRGIRANLLVIDEFRLLDKDIIDLVLKHFLNCKRHPGYLDTEEYKDYPVERNQQMYLSSAWFASHWSWTQCKDYFTNMLDSGKRYVCLCFPYQMSIKENLLDRDQVEDEMSESSFSDLKFQMEMEAEFIGVTDGGLFSFDDINRMRVLKSPIYALGCGVDNSKYKVPPKKPGEIRVLTADIALMNSKHRDNDATSIFLNCMQPTKVGRYVINFFYTENVEGIATQDLALKLRRYMEYFNVDYIGVDCKGIGLPIADLLMRDMFDPETGDTYPAISCCNNSEIAERCVDKNAPKKLWAIMGSQQFNNDVAIQLRSGFQQGRIHLLMSEYECEEQLRSEIKGYDKLTPTERTALQMPYVNTGLAVNELVNLEYEAKDNVIRVHEKTGCRKDRYSSISYNYYIAQQLERKNEKRQSTSKTISFAFRAPAVKKGGF